MKVLRNKIAALVAVAAMAAACSIDGHHGNGDDNFFSSFTTFRDTRWPYAEPLTITVDTLADSICRHGAMMLTVRHTDGYEYSNLWLEIDYDLDDTTDRADTVNVIMADVYGRWRGGGPGNSFRLSDTLHRDMPLHRGQRIGVRHIMRTDTLNQIEQIGLTYLPR